MTVERKKIEGEIDRGDLEQIVNFWNPELCRRQMAERFRKGASLWVIKHDGRLAGYGWTLKGNTIEPHYFRLAQNDVHFFDFQVFPEYRGRGMNPILVTHILSEVAAECGGRAFIEAAEWNHAQLASLRKTSFNRLGRATKFTIFGRTIVCWDESERKACGQEIELKKVPIVTGTKGSKVPDLRL
jgi:GNAT superfamily N-acetyltransferase